MAYALVHRNRAREASAKRSSSAPVTIATASLIPRAEASAGTTPYVPSY